LKWNRSRVRFTRFDSTDDQEVADALFAAVERWAKNKGMNMQAIADECGYSNVSTVFHYLDRRGLRWNQI
ncbi:MAG: hypothetical protein J6W71_01060, partial [Methanobrevibacter sp.]|nr:hypothetical protein [Methanobrevibacter sp.]